MKFLLTWFLGLILSQRNAKVVSIDGYEDVPQNDEDALKRAVARQPVSVGIEASSKSFQLYEGVCNMFFGDCS